jgi:hypothetical protein
MKLKYLSLVTVLPVAAWAAKASFDVPPSAKRQATVQIAESLATRHSPPPMKADLPSPFAPADFDKPEPAAAGTTTAGPGGLPPPTPVGGRPAGPAGGPTPAAQPAAPAGDRPILEAVAARIPALGMLTTRDGKAMLAVAGGKRFEVGTKFTVTYDNQDYELEVVSIDRTNFTLRYRGEEITRPIRLAK